MKVHWFEHVPFEGPAAIASWAEARGHELAGTRLHAGETPPDPDEYDLLAIMGGSMNVDEHDEHPWLRAEKTAIRAGIDADKRVLGVCLGAQLLAQALGATVSRNEYPEIGWFPIDLTPEAASSLVFAGLGRSLPAFHWHGDTFSLPPGAVHTASSRACGSQAFEAAGGRLVGLQYHWDYGEPSVRLMLEHASDDLVPGRWVQSPAELLAEPARFSETRQLLFTVLDRMCDLPEGTGT